MIIGVVLIPEQEEQKASKQPSKPLPGATGG